MVSTAAFLHGDEVVMPLISQRIFPTRVTPEQGFVLPVVLGVGVIMLLLGVMIIERSSQNRIVAIAQKANAQSTAAAEHGVTHLQALLNRYPSLATACSDGALSAACSSPPSWKTLNNKALEPCSTESAPSIPWLQPYANQEWKNSTTDPADGRFRLVSYEYKPDPSNAAIGTGTLVVEGQVNPDDAVRTATTKLKVEFKIARNPGLNSPPGLWIQDNQASAVSNAVQLITNVRDSTCPGGTATAVQQLQGQIQSPNVYQPTPGLAFPELPLDNAASASGTGTATPATNPASGANLIDAIEDSKAALPNPTQPPVGNVLTYRVKANSAGQSIHLTNTSDVLEIGTGATTVVLDLEGGLTLTNGGRIRLAANTTLIIYARGPVTLENKGTNAAIEQEGTPSATRAQIYVYSPPSPASPSDPPPVPYAVNLQGVNEPTLSLSLFAPSSKVTSSVKVQGNIWAKAWEGTNAAAIAQAPTSPADLKLLWPPRISPITAWTVNPQ